MDTIFTFNTRGNIFLEVMEEHLSISKITMKREIWQLFDDLRDALNKSGVQYSDLKGALVPKLDKHEAAFIFDSTSCDSNFYGGEVVEKLFPLLDSRAKHSILAGMGTILICMTQVCIVPVCR